MKESLKHFHNQQKVGFLILKSKSSLQWIAILRKQVSVNCDNAFCFNLLKNHLSELERQIEKDAIINFLSDQLVNKTLNGNSFVNKTVNDHNKFSRES